MLQKLSHYGIRGPAHDWLKSYICKRRQFVNFNGINSEHNVICCGVPQGSILGPILFLLYINDLCNVSEFLKFVLFADDTNIFASGINIEELIKQVNKELKNVNKWFVTNKLSLNVSKTNFMIFSNRKEYNNEYDIYIDQFKIIRVFSCKFLGVIIDSRLNWKEHIDIVKTKLLKCNGILYKASNILDTESLLMLYNTLFLPYMVYCCEVWGTSCYSNIASIIKLQKKVIRIIFKVNRQSHTSPLFKKLNTLKFTDIVKLKIGCLMYKASINSLPNNLQILFSKRGDYLPALRYSYLFKVQSSKSSFKSRCISIIGVKYFNELPEELCCAKNTTIFKKMYKNTLLESY